MGRKNDTPLLLCRPAIYMIAVGVFSILLISVGRASAFVVCPGYSQRPRQPIRAERPLFLSTSSTPPSDDPRVEPRIVHTITLPLPMGLLLEEMDVSDHSHGVVVIGISPEGQVAKSNINAFSSMTSQSLVDKKTPYSISDKCICIRDKIMSVNGSPCHDKSLDVVMELILESSAEVTLEIGRLQRSTVLHYSCNNNRGVCISAKPGESYGFLAEKCGVNIDYECRNGSCRTCERWMQFPDKVTDIPKSDNGQRENNLHMRTIYNCVGRVPKNYEWLHILDSNFDTDKISVDE